MERPLVLCKKTTRSSFFNFRLDRMRQLCKAFVLPTFDEFPRQVVAGLFPVTMAQYRKVCRWRSRSPETIEKTFAQVISEKGLAQLHIAETEKYAHVTFFLNGTKEEPFAGEERVIIPSPKVASYDQAPEMSARMLTDRVVKEMRDNKFDFIVMNFANPDMVGHTGNMEATIRGIETVDECIGKIVEERSRAGPCLHHGRPWQRRGDEKFAHGRNGQGARHQSCPILDHRRPV